MKYDFDSPAERRGTECMKWDGAIQKHRDDEIIPMWVADMDFRSPPEVVEALVYRAKHGFFGYNMRSDSLDEAVAGWMRRRHGWAIEKDWLVYVSGVVSGLASAVHAFTKQGDRVVVQPPVYSPFFGVVTSTGRQLALNQLVRTQNGYIVDFDSLDELLQLPDTRMLILCSPHNPVGRVWLRSELETIARMCLEHDVLIVSDEIHCDLVLPPAKHTPTAMISNTVAENTITLMAASKTFNLAGLATAYAVIPNQELRPRFSTTRRLQGSGGANTFGATATRAAYSRGTEWLEQLLTYLEDNRSTMCRFFAERIPRIKVIPPEGTYLAWLDCRALSLSDEDLQELILRKAHVLLTNGTMYGAGGEGFLRLNFGCPRTQLIQALEGIESAIANLL